MLRTQRYGRVAFAVLNHNVPVPEARRRQDVFVRALVDATGAEPWPYDTPVRPAFTTAQVELITAAVKDGASAPPQARP